MALEGAGGRVRGDRVSRTRGTQREIEGNPGCERGGEVILSGEVRFGRRDLWWCSVISAPSCSATGQGSPAVGRSCSAGARWSCARGRNPLPALGRRDGVLHRRVSTPRKPSSTQCCPERLARWPMTVLAVLSVTPLPTGRQRCVATVDGAPGRSASYDRRTDSGSPRLPHQAAWSGRSGTSGCGDWVMVAQGPSVKSRNSDTRPSGSPAALVGARVLGQASAERVLGGALAGSPLPPS